MSKQKSRTVSYSQKEKTRLPGTNLAEYQISHYGREGQKQERKRVNNMWLHNIRQWTGLHTVDSLLHTESNWTEVQKQI